MRADKITPAILSAAKNPAVFIKMGFSPSESVE